MLTTSLKAWGNSQGILLPKKLLTELDWKVSDPLELEISEYELHIRKPFVHKTFEERLAAYAGSIDVCRFDWGEPVGKELL